MNMSVPKGQKTLLAACLKAVREEAESIMNWTAGFVPDAAIYEVALTKLTSERCILYAAVLTMDHIPSASVDMERTVSGLRRAGQQQYLPLGLLTRAWLRSLTGARTGPESAQADLDEAWEIAERGPMKLFLADIHLHRARLFFREPAYPWNKHQDGTPRGPKDDLAAAEKLINTCGYHRRDEELADAKKALQI